MGPFWVPSGSLLGSLWGPYGVGLWFRLQLLCAHPEHHRPGAAEAFMVSLWGPYGVPSIWVPFGVLLGSFWGPSGSLLGWFWGPYGVGLWFRLQLLRAHPEHHRPGAAEAFMGSLWGPFGVLMGYLLYGSLLGSLWGRYGVGLWFRLQLLRAHPEHHRPGAAEAFMGSLWGPYGVLMGYLLYGSLLGSLWVVMGSVCGSGSNYYVRILSTIDRELLKPLWGPYGVLMGSLWGTFYTGPFWGRYGVVMGSVCGSGSNYYVRILSTIDRELLKPLWGPYGVLMGYLLYGSLLGSLWGRYGSVCGSGSNYYVRILSTIDRELLKPLWGPYGVPLGSLWGTFYMGPFWGRYGVVMGSVCGSGSNYYVRILSTIDRELLKPLWGPYGVLMGYLLYGSLLGWLWGRYGVGLWFRLQLLRAHPEHHRPGAAEAFMGSLWGTFYTGPFWGGYGVVMGSVCGSGSNYYVRILSTIDRELLKPLWGPYGVPSIRVPFGVVMGSLWGRFVVQAPITTCAS
eukprot:XP_025001380.1 uncharacterized protein LOC112530940 [Gallus gallus]